MEGNLNACRGVREVEYGHLAADGLNHLGVTCNVRD